MSNNQVQTESTNLAVVEENSLGAKTPPTTGWFNLQPNSYGSFASQYKKLPRDPISKNAQLQKGMLVDEDSGISFEMDVTKDAIDRFAGGIFRCVAKHSGNKGQSLYRPTAVTGTGYTVPALGDLFQYFLIYARGLGVAANDGLKQLGAGSIATEIKTAGLAVQASVPSNATVEIAGYRGQSGDIELDADGNLISTLADFTTWGLNPYQWVSIGDPNDATHSFAIADFIGSARVETIAAHKITFSRRNWLVEQKAYLDLGTLAANLDSVVQAKVTGAAGDTISVTAVDDGVAAVKAFLDLDTPSLGINTVVRAKVAGTVGNDITVEVYGGAPTAAGVLTEVGRNVKLQVKLTAVATTITDLEALIATSTLIEVKTPGTGAHTIVAGDVFNATALASGTNATAASVSEIGDAVTLHFTGSATTVAEIEAAITATSTKIEIKTAGTPGAVLVNTSDEFGPDLLDHGTSGADDGAGKTIDVYFSRWYRNVATDHADYRAPSFAFEITYQTLNDGAPEYEYPLGNMVDEWKWNIPLTTKATISAKFVGTKTLNPTTSRKTGPSAAINPSTNLGVSTATDLLRLRMSNVDESGISTDFQSLTVTSTNGVSAEKQLAELGATKMNIGKHKAMVDAACIFTSSDVIKAVKDNRDAALDVMMRNADFGALLDVQSMTLDSADRKLERDKSVIVDSKASGFQDKLTGSTESLSVFAYLPPIVADDE
jgi:hypothetical protein